MKALEKLKSFEDACKVLKLKSDKVIPDFSSFPKEDHAAMIAHAKLVIIARAANKIANKGKVWKPDWSNYSQWKYYPWFEMRGSSGFRFSDVVCWGSYSSVGSRLCYISRDVATYIGTAFKGLYELYFTIK